MKIPFSRQNFTGFEFENLKQLINAEKLEGDGEFTIACQKEIEDYIGCKKSYLVHSGTAALEMAALILNVNSNDEVILPSYTFVTTASAFALRGAKLKFVDICSKTLNLQVCQLKKAITEKTKVIVPVHYAGLSCNMDEILSIADKCNAYVVEDAAQAYGSSYRGDRLGSLGDIGCFSFHGTKNISCGEGGAITINNLKLVKRAEVIREKGTDRSAFFRGEVDKYTWRALGSSYLPSELTAAFLLPQLKNCDQINEKRLYLWDRYYNNLKGTQYFKLPEIFEDRRHNGHIFYLVARHIEDRENLRKILIQNGIVAASHYVPLHSSDMGQKFGLPLNDMRNTDEISNCILRLPLWPDMSVLEVDEICTIIKNSFK
ncbi:dTDP-4-amino-4,6-dideoxygalactose transaminase [Amylibacter sp.]|nr:dTDP-4-amino-4,6-dideoxygalactose transaminase [Amylibacter sp.]